jgi:predicted Zn-dependent protease
MTITQVSLPERVLALSSTDQTEVIVAESDRQLTRFANSEIHQNVAERDTEVRVRTVVDGRVGVASTNDLSDEGLSNVVARAAMLARYALPNPEFRSLPGSATVRSLPAAYDEATSRTTPEERARAVEVICRLAVEEGLKAFGAFETSTGRLTVVNSLGLRVQQQATKCDLNTVVMGPDSAGYASHSGASRAGVDAEALARAAIAKAKLGAHPQDLAPGAYTVLLEEDAVADLVEHVASAGFGGQQFNDGVSFMAGHLGEQLVGENVTILDDPLADDMMAIAFDGEGVPKAPLTLIERGVARAVAHDTLTGPKAGLASTGHALPAPNSYGPYPTRLRMLGGSTPKAELIKGIERGIWVTRFHYTNLAEARTATITGMTRDGTYLIERGEIVRPLKNMRFTSGGLEALRNVRAIGRETKLTLGYMGVTRAPAIVVDGFQFTGVTRF